MGAFICSCCMSPDTAYSKLMVQDRLQGGMTVISGGFEFADGKNSVKCLICQLWFNCDQVARHLGERKHYKNIVRATIAEIDAYLARANSFLSAMD